MGDIARVGGKSGGSGRSGSRSPRPAYARGVRRPVSGPTFEADINPRVDRAYPWERTGGVDVELLLHWAFAVQRVDQYAGDGLFRQEREAEGRPWFSHSSDGVYVIQQRDRIGCDIDATPVSKTPDVHPAAEAVLVAVRGCGQPALVRDHAFAGTRPGGWAAPAQWIVPCQWKPGRADVDAEWEYAGPRTANPYCPVMPVTSPEGIERARRIYATWLATLDEIALMLAMRNIGFVVMPPAAHPAPWEVE